MTKLAGEFPCGGACRLLWCFLFHCTLFLWLANYQFAGGGDFDRFSNCYALAKAFNANIMSLAVLRLPFGPR